jgi:hypothetical protein
MMNGRTRTLAGERNLLKVLWFRGIKAKPSGWRFQGQDDVNKFTRLGHNNNVTILKMMMLLLRHFHSKWDDAVLERGIPFLTWFATHSEHLQSEHFPGLHVVWWVQLWSTRTAVASALAASALERFIDSVWDPERLVGLGVVTMPIGDGGGAAFRCAWSMLYFHLNSSPGAISRVVKINPCLLLKLPNLTDDSLKCSKSGLGKKTSSQFAAIPVRYELFKHAPQGTPFLKPNQMSEIKNNRYDTIRLACSHENHKWNNNDDFRQWPNWRHFGRGWLRDLGNIFA